MSSISRWELQLTVYRNRLDSHSYHSGNEAIQALAADKGRPDLATYGRVWLGKTDATTRPPETQLHTLQEYDTWEEHVFSDEMTVSSMARPPL